MKVYFNTYLPTFHMITFVFNMLVKTTVKVSICLVKKSKTCQLF